MTTVKPLCDLLKQQYQYRHRLWVMDYYPSMSERDWEKYTQWVAAFMEYDPDLPRDLTVTRNVSHMMREIKMSASNKS